jgi:hypothetical protein
MAAVATLCLVRLLTVSEPFDGDHVILTLFCLLAAALVVGRHHANIARLIHGNENRLPDTPAMLTLTKTVHVLALGLWFGMMVFFTFVIGLVLFFTLEHLTDTKKTPEEARPIWLGRVPPGFDKAPPSPSFPDPLSKEQGRRIFGAAVAPLFAWYFGIQAGCGVFGLATAWSWSRGQLEKVHRLRTVILAVALATVAVGWWLDREVTSRRGPRDAASNAVLKSLADSSSAPEHLVRAADKARAEFDHWHSAALTANFVTLVLVTVGMVLAARMPEGAKSVVPSTEYSVPSG